MKQRPQTPLRAITPDEISSYCRDGVVLLRGLLQPEWLQRIESAVTRLMSAPSPISAIFSKPEAGFQMEVGLFTTDDDVRDVVHGSPLARIAQELMGSERVHFFYDQMFCKQPGNQIATPWHQDITFWPVDGDQICSIWVPLDSVTRESSGLEFVRGSHRWQQRFKAVSPMYNQQLIDPEHAEVPDIDGNPDQYDLVGWSMEPGDLLIFHPVTLHGSGGNTHSSRPRRALSFRWLGDDVVYAPTPYTMPYPVENLEPGDPIAAPAFTKII